MEAIIAHYLTTHHELTSTDRLILMLIHDAGDWGTTVPVLADLCGTSWEYTQARIYVLQRAGLLRRVKPRHYAVVRIDIPAPACISSPSTASGSVPAANGVEL
jgi:hypothetical protein